MNEEVRKQGWKIDFYSGEVPKGGDVHASTYYTGS